MEYFKALLTIQCYARGYLVRKKIALRIKIVLKALQFIKAKKLNLEPFFKSKDNWNSSISVNQWIYKLTDFGFFIGEINDKKELSGRGILLKKDVLYEGFFEND